MKVRTTEGFKNVPLTEVTKENYIVPKGEENVYHCLIEVRKFDSNTGKRLSIPRIQKVGAKSFDTICAHNWKLQGYTVTILHDPSEYIMKKKEEDAKLAAERAEQQKIAEEKKKAAEMEEMKRQIREELLEEMRKSNESDVKRGRKKSDSAGEVETGGEQ